MRHGLSGMIIATCMSFVIGVSAAGVAGAAAPNAEQPPAGVAGEPGRYNAITDVPGVRVGQVQSDANPYLTGVTVVYMPRMSIAGVSQIGGAPATRETDLLRPVNSNPGVNAIMLGGSSMFGLTAAGGIYRWLADHGQGFPVGKAGVAPIVPGADIFDLGRGGDPQAHTSPPWGYLAIEAASDGPVRQGTVGGGTGALAGGLKSGVGTASVYLGNGIYVGAIVVANAAGSTVDPRDCSISGTRYGIGTEFAGIVAPTRSECDAHPVREFGSGKGGKRGGSGSAASMNTTIAVVATNASLSKAAAQRMAENANDGMARAIDPIHTLVDGDTIFAVATGDGAPLQVNKLADMRELSVIFEAGARALSRAIAKAVLAATSRGTYTSYCDTYPSACANARNLEDWRSQGNAPSVTKQSFERAARALELAPIP